MNVAFFPARTSQVLGCLAMPDEPMLIAPSIINQIERLCDTSEAAHSVGAPKAPPSRKVNGALDCRRSRACGYGPVEFPRVHASVHVGLGRSFGADRRSTFAPG